MTTADTVLVPIQCEYYALEGLSQLIHTVNLVKERLNPNLEMDGVVFTMYDSRTNLSLQVVENVKENISEKVYNTIIPIINHYFKLYPLSRTFLKLEILIDGHLSFA